MMIPLMIVGTFEALEGKSSFRIPKNSCFWTSVLAMFFCVRFWIGELCALHVGGRGLVAVSRDLESKYSRH